MTISVTILQVVTHIALVVVPALEVFRDWKHHDRKTRRHRQITRWMLWLWLVFGLISGGLYIYEVCETTALQSEIDELIEGKNQLVQQNQQLLNEVAAQQGKIRELETKANMTSHGIISTYDYNGVKREQRAGQVTATAGKEFSAFQQMDELKQACEYTALVSLCEQQIKRTPGWLTPYLFCGIAYHNLGDYAKAIVYYRYVSQNAFGDPLSSPLSSYPQTVQSYRTPYQGKDN